MCSLANHVYHLIECALCAELMLVMFMYFTFPLLRILIHTNKINKSLTLYLKIYLPERSKKLSVNGWFVPSCSHNYLQTILNLVDAVCCIKYVLCRGNVFWMVIMLILLVLDYLPPSFKNENE